MGSTQFGNFHVSPHTQPWIPGILESWNPRLEPRIADLPLSGMTGLLSRLDTASLQRT